jgi:hypothetical protein
MTQHLIHLSNGQKIILQEEDDALSISSCEESDSPEWFICQINCNGVLVYPNSGYAPEYLTRGLKKDESQSE